jgi:hypothetical protein
MVNIMPEMDNVFHSFWSNCLESFVYEELHGADFHELTNIIKRRDTRPHPAIEIVAFTHHLSDLSW